MGKGKNKENAPADGASVVVDAPQPEAEKPTTRGRGRPAFTGPSQANFVKAVEAYLSEAETPLPSWIRQTAATQVTPTGRVTQWAEFQTNAMGRINEEGLIEVVSLHLGGYKRVVTSIVHNTLNPQDFVPKSEA